jgi:SlyX protein
MGTFLISWKRGRASKKYLPFFRPNRSGIIDHHRRDEQCLLDFSPVSPFSSPGTMNPNDRLAALEEKLAFLERAVNDLSDVVVRQQKELDRATDRHQRLIDKLAAMESDPGSSLPAEEKPPHY